MPAPRIPARSGRCGFFLVIGHLVGVGGRVFVALDLPVPDQLRRPARGKVAFLVELERIGTPALQLPGSHSRKYDIQAAGPPRPDRVRPDRRVSVGTGASGVWALLSAGRRQRGWRA